MATFRRLPCLPDQYLVAIVSRGKGNALAYFRISLLLMMRLISSITKELTHTSFMGTVSVDWSHFGAKASEARTLFPNQAVISVIGIVCITRNRTATIANDTEVEFWEEGHVSSACGHARAIIHKEVAYPGTHGRSDQNAQSYVNASLAKEHYSVEIADKKEYSVLVSHVEAFVRVGRRHDCLERCRWLGIGKVESTVTNGLDLSIAIIS